MVSQLGSFARAGVSSEAELQLEMVDLVVVVNAFHDRGLIVLLFLSFGLVSYLRELFDLGLVGLAGVQLEFFSGKPPVCTLTAVYAYNTLPVDSSAIPLSAAILFMSIPDA